MQSRATAGAHRLCLSVTQTLTSSHASDTHPTRCRSASLSRLRVISLITLDTASCAFYMCVSMMCPQRLEGGKRGSKTPRHKAKSILIHAHARACSHTSNKEMSARWLEGIVSPSLRCSPCFYRTVSSSLSPLWMQQSYTMMLLPSAQCCVEKANRRLPGSDG